MIYIALYFFLLLLSLISFYSDRYKKVGYLSATIFLILLAAMRYNTGTDFSTYKTIWNGINTFNLSFDFGYSYLEPGFLIFTSILKTVYAGDFIFFSVYAILTLGILTYALYRLNLNVVAGLFLYFCFFYFVYAFNAMRQALGMSIFLYSLVFLKTGDQKKYYLLNILGLCFHYSSIAYILLGFIFSLKISKSRLLFFIILILLGGAVAYLTDAVELLIQVIFSNFMEVKLEIYFSDFRGQTSLVTFLPRLLLFGWIVFCTMKLPTDKMLLVMVLFYAVGFGIYISLLDFNYLNARINMLFRITDIIIALLLVNNMNKSRNKLLVFSVFLAIYTSYFINNMLIPENAYMLRSSL